MKNQDGLQVNEETSLFPLLVTPCKPSFKKKKYNPEWYKQHRIKNHEKYLRYHREYRGKNRDELKRKHHEYYLNHKEIILKKAKEYDSKNKDYKIKRAKSYRLKTNYGITQNKYDSMVKEQRGKCAICENEPKNIKSDFLVVDHDHKTSGIRNLLCNSCNSGLGFFKDDPQRLLKAYIYLKSFIEKGESL